MLTMNATWCFILFLLQLDIRGNPYGLLAAHPLAPLVSLHHLDYLEPIFPNQTRLSSLNSLRKPYRVDPSRILQQCVCYDRKRKWSISISWGYTIQVYPFMVPVKDLQKPLQTFKTWRSWSSGPFTFNTRPVRSNPCDRPIVYYLERVEEVGKSGSLTIYKRSVIKEGKECDTQDYRRAKAVQSITVSSLKLDPQIWKKVTNYLSLLYSYAWQLSFEGACQFTNKRLILIARAGST